MTLPIPKLITPPATTAVTLAAAKSFLRVDGAAEDDIITTMIEGAIDFAELHTGRCFITRTLRITLDAFPSTGRNGQWWSGVRQGSITELLGTGGAIRLPRPPVIDVTSIVTTAEDGTATTFDGGSYRVNPDGEAIILRDGFSWPTGYHRSGGIAVTYRAGYGPNPTDVPAAIRMAILKQVARMYEERNCAEMDPEAQRILAPYRILQLA